MRADLDVLKLAAELAARGEPFALAIVVRREPASSAQAGNMALITRSGDFHGWLGGSCIQPTVLREAQAVLAGGEPRLVALSPDPGAERRSGVSAHPMTCHSGGSVDIYLQPVLPAPRLLVFGMAPVARALVRLGKAMGWAVDAADPEADRGAFPEADRLLTAPDAPELRPGAGGSAGALYAVVATLGQRDEEALLAALALEPAYVGVVASRKRYAQVRQALLERGASAQALERIHNPAGLDLGATRPEEIALSILAEVVRERRQAQARPAAPEAPAPEEARDPICGMSVVVEGAAHTAQHAGVTYYFCRAGCRERFLATPERYLAAARVGGAP